MVAVTTGWLETIDIYSLKVLEARGPSSVSLGRGQGEAQITPPLLEAFGESQAAGILDLWLLPFQLYLCGHSASSVLRLPLPPPSKDRCDCFSDPPGYTSHFKNFKRIDTCNNFAT